MIQFYKPLISHLKDIEKKIKNITGYYASIGPDLIGFSKQW